MEPLIGVETFKPRVPKQFLKPLRNYQLESNTYTGQ